MLVRLDAHYLLMLAKKDREKLGGIGGKTLRLRISQKYKSRDGSRDLYFSQARSAWMQAAGHDRAGDLRVNPHVGLFLGRACSAIGQ